MANPAPDPLSPNARKAGLERRIKYSRRYYKEQLIAIATGQESKTGIQLRALLEYGSVMGWHANARPKKKTAHTRSSARVTDDLLVRMRGVQTENF